MARYCLAVRNMQACSASPSPSSPKQVVENDARQVRYYANEVRYYAPEKAYLTINQELSFCHDLIP